MVHTNASHLQQLSFVEILNNVSETPNTDKYLLIPKSTTKLRAYFQHLKAILNG